MGAGLRWRLVTAVALFGGLAALAIVLSPLIGSTSIDLRTALSRTIPFEDNPDAQVLFRESSLSATIRTAQPWTDMSSNSWRNARFFEYANTGSGAFIA